MSTDLIIYLAAGWYVGVLFMAWAAGKTGHSDLDAGFWVLILLWPFTAPIAFAYNSGRGGQ